MAEIPSPEPAAGATATGPSPWRAVLINLVVPPVGHLYAGAPRRGLAIWAGAQAAGFALGWGAGIAPGRFFLVALALVILAAWSAFMLDAARSARRSHAAGSGSGRVDRLGYAGAVVLVLFADWAIGEARRALVAHAVKVPSASMAPTILAGDELIVSRDLGRRRDPRRGEVVEFAFPRAPSQRFLKRVIGLPGETIEIRDREVWVNGAPLVEPYALHRDPAILPAEESPRDNFAPWTIGPGEVFLMGDDRENSNDSRFQGAVPATMLLGRAALVYWSWDARRAAVRWDRIGLAIR